MNYFYKNILSYLIFAFLPAALLISIALALFFLKNDLFLMLSERTQVQIFAGCIFFGGLWALWSYTSKHGEKTINSWGSKLFGQIECDIKGKSVNEKTSFFYSLLDGTFKLVIILGPSIIILITIGQINVHIAFVLTIISFVVWVLWTVTEYGEHKVEAWSNTLLALLIKKFFGMRKKDIRSGKINYCPNCGTKVGYKDNFCLYCGKKFL